MASLTEAKTMGGVGSILVLLTAVPSIGWILGIIGFILTLIAIHYISDTVGDRTIFNNMIISVILVIVGLIVAGMVVIGSLLSYFGVAGLSGVNFEMSPTYQQGHLVAFVLALLPALAVVWISLIISAIFLRRSYSSIAEKINVHMFDTAGLIFLIGAVTTIIAVGFLIILIAEILVIIAFFSIKEEQALKKPVQPA